MKEMRFTTVGVLPEARGRWHVREGGGRIWFVNEAPETEPLVLLDGALVRVVDAAIEPDAPLVQPLVDAYR